jgi:hypothetical protein
MSQEQHELFVSPLERYTFLLDATRACPFGSRDPFKEKSLVFRKERGRRLSALREWAAVGVGG